MAESPRVEPEPDDHRRQVWRRRFGIAALIAAFAWWPVAALVDWSPVAVAVILAIAVVLVVGFTTAWYALADLRPEPSTPSPTSQSSRPQAEAEQPGCVHELLVELAGWVLLALLSIPAGWGLKHHPVATIAIAVIAVAGSAVVAWVLERRRAHRSHVSPR